MRFIITARRDDANPKADPPFDENLFAAYMKFNEELYQAGVLVASEGLGAALPDRPRQRRHPRDPAAHGE